MHTVAWRQSSNAAAGTNAPAAAAVTLQDEVNCWGDFEPAAAAGAMPAPAAAAVGSGGGSSVGVRSEGGCEPWRVEAGGSLASSRWVVSG